MGYPLKPFTGTLSIYSSDVEGLKELMSTILKENEIKDSSPVWLFHSSPEWTKDFVQLGLSMADFEGVVEIWFDSVEDLEALYCSPEHVAEMMPDEAMFVNLERSGVMMGYDSVETEKFTAAF
ncbi:hypothetical protein R1sor_013435 [Riccia sorocarpa]|uniref:EthD domain-containing protein n=1 Tax=Riccia sorocarpa TaxID=122646 RepID=A0ABD3H8E5_9MARC